MVDYIDAQFEAYLQEELKIKRSLPAYHDSRLHVCLYFICPTGEFLVKPSVKTLYLITAGCQIQMSKPFGFDMLDIAVRYMNGTF